VDVDDEHRLALLAPHDVGVLYLDHHGNYYLSCDLIYSGDFWHQSSTISANRCYKTEIARGQGT